MGRVMGIFMQGGIYVALTELLARPERLVMRIQFLGGGKPRQSEA